MAIISTEIRTLDPLDAEPQQVREKPLRTATSVNAEAQGYRRFVVLAVPQTRHAQDDR